MNFWNVLRVPRGHNGWRAPDPSALCGREGRARTYHHGTTKNNRATRLRLFLVGREKKQALTPIDKLLHHTFFSLGFSYDPTTVYKSRSRALLCTVPPEQKSHLVGIETPASTKGCVGMLTVLSSTCQPYCWVQRAPKNDGHMIAKWTVFNASGVWYHGYHGYHGTVIFVFFFSFFFRFVHFCFV